MRWRGILECAILLGLLICASPIEAQTVQQSGSVTPGHAVKWTSTGVISDGGTASNGLLTSLGVTASGPGICQQSGPNTGALNRVCLDVTSTGGGISMTNVGGATGGFTFTLNGVTQGMGTVTLPVTAGNFACFADTAGTLQDCGGSLTAPANPATSVQFNAAGVFGGSANLTWVSPALSIGAVGSATGQLKLLGTTSGTVTQTVQAAAGTPTITWGTSSGTPAVTASAPLAITSATGNITCATCGTSTLTSAHIFVGNGSNLATDVAVTGDISITNAGVVTVSKVNGISYPVSPYVVGDFLYADTTTSMARRAAVATGSVLASAGTGTAPAWSASPTLTTSLTVPTLYGGSAVGSTLTVKGTSNAAPVGDKVSFMSGTRNIWGFKQNPAGDVGGTYVECWPGNTASFQNAECDVLSSISTAGLSFRMKGDWPFVLHAPSDQSASALFCMYESEANGTDRMCWYAASSIASSYTLVWPNAVASVNGQCLTSTTGGVLSWATCSTGGITIGSTVITSGTSGRILYDNAGVLGEMTTSGSGTVVALATSPTLTTAVAAGTWTASGTWTIPAVTLGGTVSGGGNQINNVIIGTSTPLAGTFTTLAGATVNIGAQTALNSGVIAQFSANAAAIPAGTFAGTIFQFANVDGSSTRATVATFRNGNTVNASLSFTSANGTAASRTATTANNILGTFFFQGAIDGTSFNSAPAAFFCAATETFSSTVSGTRCDINTVVTGSNTNSTYRFQASGGFSIGATTDPGAGGLHVEGATITFNNLATDATHTDRTVCQDTTSKALFFGSGAAGICLGTSSARFKRDIRDLKGEGLSQILALRPRMFHYQPGYGDDGAREQYGFIAEEVEKVLPKMVGRDAEGKIANLDYGALWPISVRAIQELKAANDNLSKRIAVLERRIAGGR